MDLGFFTGAGNFSWPVTARFWRSKKVSINVVIKKDSSNAV